MTIRTISSGTPWNDGCDLLTCKNCRQRFLPKKDSQRFCSVKCRVAVNGEITRQRIAAKRTAERLQHGH